MKRTITSFSLIMLALILLCLSLTNAQKKPAITRVAVTAKSIPTQSGAPFVIDLTRKGVAYELAAGLDPNRVHLRTSKGEQALRAVFANRAITGKLLLGLTDDLRQLPLNLGGSSGSHYNCDIPSLCSCSGDADCDDLFRSGNCGDLAVCKETRGSDGTSCWCLKKV